MTDRVDKFEHPCEHLFHAKVLRPIPLLGLLESRFFERHTDQSETRVVVPKGSELEVVELDRCVTGIEVSCESC